MVKYKNMIKEIGHCELCNSKRNLEVHHIVPKVACSDIIDPNCEDNLIVVCGSCHAKLTPRRFLCKIGVNKMPIQLKNGNIINELDLKKWRLFYDKLTDCRDFSDVVDLVEYIFNPFLSNDERKMRGEYFGL